MPPVLFLLLLLATVCKNWKAFRIMVFSVKNIWLNCRETDMKRLRWILMIQLTKQKQLLSATGDSFGLLSCFFFFWVAYLRVWHLCARVHACLIWQPFSLEQRCRGSDELNPLLNTETRPASDWSNVNLLIAESYSDHSVTTLSTRPTSCACKEHSERSVTTLSTRPRKCTCCTCND